MVVGSLRSGRTPFSSTAILRYLRQLAERAATTRIGSPFTACKDGSPLLQGVTC